jgi:chaperone modulatory protein CbpM
MNSDNLGPGDGAAADGPALTLDDLAHACCRERAWVQQRLDAGLLGQAGSQFFGSVDLTRARRLAAAEHMFDANPDAAAFIADLIEEVQLLRRKLRNMSDNQAVLIMEIDASDAPC